MLGDLLSSDGTEPGSVWDAGMAAEARAVMVIAQGCLGGDGVIAFSPWWFTEGPFSRS